MLHVAARASRRAAAAVVDRAARHDRAVQGVWRTAAAAYRVAIPPAPEDLHGALAGAEREERMPLEQMRLAALLVAIVLLVLAGWPQLPHSQSLLAFGLGFLALAHFGG